ncbi:MAG: ribbon-helix-helix protein, CopG family [Coraliomargaritaceae bacterium]
MMEKHKQITLQLELETLERLKEQAHREGNRPVASLIREILQNEISTNQQSVKK